ncbi:MAG: hypothetical protein PGN07_11135 [Aeromicrobium erythreum]
MPTVHVTAVADDDVAAVVAEIAGRAVRVGRHCPRCGSRAHGRPVVDADGVHVSLARAGGRTVVAVADVAVGVDAERPGTVPADAVTAVGLEPGADPTRAWVRAEAVGKLTGDGLTVAPTADAVVVAADLPGLVVAVATWEPAEVVVRAGRAG